MLIYILPIDSYVPYKYDLDAFISVGSVTKDHLDPSVFTVLTARSKTPGAALADFAVFKERWDVATGTFRPPVRTCYTILLYLSWLTDGIASWCSTSTGTLASRL